MGLFSFLKGKGKTLGSAQAGEAPSAEAMSEEFKANGLEERLEVAVEGDTVMPRGTPASQEQREKVIVALGNVEGIAAVDDGTGGSDPVLYTVEAGDTLSGMAKATLGDANRYMEIFGANTPMLSDPDKAYPGQTLRIPST